MLRGLCRRQIWYIEHELGIITGLSRGFEQRRARAERAEAPVRLDLELRNEGKLPENWGPVPAARGRFSRTRSIKSSVHFNGLQRRIFTALTVVRQRSFGWHVTR